MLAWFFVLFIFWHFLLLLCWDFSIPDQPALIDFIVWFHTERTFELCTEKLEVLEISQCFYEYLSSGFVCVNFLFEEVCWLPLLSSPTPAPTHTYTHICMQYCGFSGSVVNHSLVFYLLSVYSTMHFGAWLISLFLEIL